MYKGMGEKQEKMKENAIQKILKVLMDGKWHRYKELQQSTGLSTATLSKHLKELEKGIIERKIDTESKEYPPPVIYRLKPELTRNFPKGSWDKLGEAITLYFPHIKNKYVFLDCIYSIIETLAILFLINLKMYFEKQKNKTQYNQFLEYVILNGCKEALQKLTDELDRWDKKEAETLVKEALHIRINYGIHNIGDVIQAKFDVKLVEFFEKMGVKHDIPRSKQLAELVKDGELQEAEKIWMGIQRKMYEFMGLSFEDFAERVKKGLIFDWDKILKEQK